MNDESEEGKPKRYGRLAYQAYTIGIGPKIWSWDLEDGLSTTHVVLAFCISMVEIPKTVDQVSLKCN